MISLGNTRLANLKAAQNHLSSALALYKKKLDQNAEQCRSQLRANNQPKSTIRKSVKKIRSRAKPIAQEIEQADDRIRQIHSRPIHALMPNLIDTLLQGTEKGDELSMDTTIRYYMGPALRMLQKLVDENKTGKFREEIEENLDKARKALNEALG